MLLAPMIVTHSVLQYFVFAVPTECPPNSEATQTGLTECTCVPGYYRATDEGPSVACTREYSTSEQYQSIYCSQCW